MNREGCVTHVHELLNAWNARDLDAYVALLSPDVRWHDLAMASPPAVGRDAVRHFCETILRAFPDFRYEIRAPICVADDGNSCTVPWTITATHLGVLQPPGFTPTGRTLNMHGFDYIQFRDGQVANMESRFDPAEAIEQLMGVRLRPNPGSFAERCLVLLQRIAANAVRRKRKADSHAGAI